ncbi:SurA N-terminal domain-containing protein, partial [Alphaproteobacteria bacterium]|nr:SurA N-terminal domain-containing protein [Alphaproteobacteria bacterium]
MLKKITTPLKSLGTKSLILIIALSFAVWGVGDIFTGGSNPTVATVGNSKIALKQFNLEYQGILEKLRQGTDEPITDEFVKAMGLQNTVINNMINQKYVNILSKDLGIKVS